jgi:anthranilate synthase component 1
MLIKEFPDIDQYRHLAKQSNVIPVCVEILADTNTPVSLLKKIYKNNGSAFLFESVEGGERWGRYSFLGVSARTHIRIFPQFVEIREDSVCQQIPHHGDPLCVLKTWMNKYRPAHVPELPRFWGGLVGYLTYEMVSFFESIPNLLPENKPIAHFIIPDELLIFERPFSEGNDTPIHTEFTLKESLEARTFRSLVKKVKEYIRAGDVIQTVISMPFFCAPPPDLWALYRAQRFINPSPYLYYLGLDEMTLVGSSPETMVRLENGVATLRPIAGTRPRGKNEQEDRSLANELLADEKERAEHLMLVDLGRNDLGRVAEVGTVQVTDLMVVERYSHVMHLVSNISCDLKSEYDAWDLRQY